VPLKVESFRATAVQFTIQFVYPKKPKPYVKENVKHAIAAIHASQYGAVAGSKLIAFPEFTLAGSRYQLWTRKNYLDLAIELPGEETDQIGECAKMYDCYIEMAAHTKAPEWPNHFLNTSFIIGPNGKVIHQHWKASWEWATSVHEVLDEFVKRYGWEAVWPVARTDIGNIATYICSEGFYPETARIFALNGAEILVRSFGSGGSTTKHYVTTVIRQAADCASNNCYGVLANNSAFFFKPDFDKSKPYREGWEPSFAIWSGYSTIFNPDGTILNQLKTCTEGIVSAQIPIAAHRKGRSIPALMNELYAPGYQRPSKYPKNMYINHQPRDVKDAVRYNQEKAQW